MSNLIVVFGASGFIGRRIVDSLARNSNYSLRLVTRDNDFKIDVEARYPNVEVVMADLSLPLIPQYVFERGCIVINLVYFWQGGSAANLLAIENILNSCQIAGIKRLIHFSTAAVSGRVSDNLVDENSECIPITDYGVVKLNIENRILSNPVSFERVILRPTAVYGIGGMPLKKLATDLLSGSHIMNYIKGCLFGRRRMNLVHVENVVDATIFIVNIIQNIDSEIFIISDDSDVKNNFYDVSCILCKEFFNSRYLTRPVFVPFWVLGFILRLLGRNNINPKCNYSQDKILSLGFVPQIEFSVGVLEYARWFRGMVKPLGRLGRS